jgi:hypothetical protein
MFTFFTARYTQKSGVATKRLHRSPITRRSAFRTNRIGKIWIRQRLDVVGGVQPPSLQPAAEPATAS